MTDEELEDYLVTTIKKEIMRTPETLDARIFMQVQEILRAEDHKTVKFRWKAPVAAAVACAFLVSAVSVYAGLSHYQERLASLSDEEKDRYVYELDVSRTNADSFSRKLTGQELERILKLDQEYQAGRIFPESEIPVTSSSERVKNGRLTFAVESSTFFLPDSELTDEEMLEIIDFYHKRDYSLAEAQRGQDGTEGSDSPVYCLVSQSMAVQTAQDFVEDVCGIEAEDYLLDVTLDEEQRYLISFFSPEGFREYTISVNAGTGKIGAFDFAGSNEKDTRSVVDEEKYISKYADAELFLRTRLGVLNDIAQSFCTYNVTNEDQLHGGRICYTFQLDDGNYYVLYYDVLHDQIQAMYVFSTDEYQNVIDRIEERLGSQGITMRRIDFTR